MVGKVGYMGMPGVVLLVQYRETDGTETSGQTSSFGAPDSEPMEEVPRSEMDDFSWLWLTWAIFVLLMGGMTLCLATLLP